MKNLFFIIAAFVMQMAAMAQDAGKTADIDNTVATIKSNLKTYKTEDYKYPTDITETTYYDNKTIKAVKTFVVDNNTNKTTTSYFSGGQMIYHEQIWTDNNGKIVHTELSYLSNHHLVKWTLDDKEMTKSSEYWKGWDKQLYESSKSFRKNT
ncbi:MAG: hypothetical protein ACXVPN_12990 [Bacteroidia bacterium]